MECAKALVAVLLADTRHVRREARGESFAEGEQKLCGRAAALRARLERSNRSDQCGRLHLPVRAVRTPAQCGREWCGQSRCSACALLQCRWRASAPGSRRQHDRRTRRALLREQREQIPHEFLPEAETIRQRIIDRGLRCQLRRGAARGARVLRIRQLRGTNQE